MKELDSVIPFGSFESTLSNSFVCGLNLRIASFQSSPNLKFPPKMYTNSPSQVTKMEVRVVFRDDWQHLPEYLKWYCTSQRWKFINIILEHKVRACSQERPNPSYRFNAADYFTLILTHDPTQDLISRNYMLWLSCPRLWVEVDKSQLPQLRSRFNMMMKQNNVGKLDVFRWC